MSGLDDFPKTPKHLQPNEYPSEAALHEIETAMEGLRRALRYVETTDNNVIAYHMGRYDAAHSLLKSWHEDIKTEVAMHRLALSKSRKKRQSEGTQ